MPFNQLLSTDGLVDLGEHGQGIVRFLVSCLLELLPGCEDDQPGLARDGMEFGFVEKETLATPEQGAVRDKALRPTKITKKGKRCRGGDRP